MKKTHRIIIDTNLWISFLLTKQFSFIDKFIENKKVQLIFSEELLTEFLEVVERPKFRKYFTKENMEHVFEIVEQYAEFVTVSSNVEICRDKKDNFLLSLAKDSAANFLITGDKDLLVIKKFENTEIITIVDYRTQHK